MFANTKNNIRLITLKMTSIFTAYGKNKNGKFSLWFFLRFCFSNIGFRLFFKYILQTLTILFDYNFDFIRKWVYTDLSTSGIKVFDSHLDVLKVAASLSFKKSIDPKVSIIVAVHNNLPYTLMCLKAIMEHTDTNIDYEVIVINDCSTDNSLDFLNRIPNVIIYSNEKNLGFVLSCNKGASIAKGNYLCFLNNDTVVQPNWLKPLVDLIEKDPKVGIVGSKLLFGDGDLQEAGGIVWQDGQTFHYGRRDSFKNKKYNYTREVDYCSGACLLISKADFYALNGFDEIYTPGYYEDVDLCFSVKYVLGKKIIYQPDSVVVHFEGVTSGNNFNSGMRRFQQINALKFNAKWKKELKTKYPNSFMNLNETLVKYEMIEHLNS